MIEGTYGVSELNPVVVQGGMGDALMGMLSASLGFKESESNISAGIKAYFADLRCPNGGRVSFTLRPKTLRDQVSRPLGSDMQMLRAVKSASQRVFDVTCDCGSSHGAVVFVQQSEKPTRVPQPLGLASWTLVGDHAKQVDEELARDEREREEKRKKEVEQHRIASVKATRCKARQCELCGRALSVWDRMHKRTVHPGCTAFKG